MMVLLKMEFLKEREHLFTKIKVCMLGRRRVVKGMDLVTTHLLMVELSQDTGPMINSRNEFVLIIKNYLVNLFLINY